MFFPFLLSVFISSFFFYFFLSSSEFGSFTEGDIHIGRDGLSIVSAPKSPQVEATIAKEELEIDDDMILGQGASGIVKLGYDKRHKRKVAVKVL